MKKLINWIGNSWVGKKVAYIVENYLQALIILAALGIISAIIEHYRKIGFNWKKKVSRRFRSTGFSLFYF